jgi:hypothetical protein
LGYLYQAVLPAPNKDIGLTAQRPEVQLRGTIEAIKIYLYLVEFYPLMVSRGGWVRPRMATVAVGNASMIHVLERLQNDPLFSAILSPIVS